MRDKRLELKKRRAVPPAEKTEQIQALEAALMQLRERRRTLETHPAVKMFLNIGSIIGDTKTYIRSLKTIPKNEHKETK